MAQIKSLSEMGWFLSAGTVAQMCALAILIVKVLAEPHPQAKTVLFNTSDWPAAAVAIMNVVYAFSGQSAYVEIIAEMKGPHRFPSALGAATAVMVVAYLGIGVAGYASQVILAWHEPQTQRSVYPCPFLLMSWCTHNEQRCGDSLTRRCMRSCW